jgi:hypothetical protein
MTPFSQNRLATRAGFLHLSECPAIPRRYSYVVCGYCLVKRILVNLIASCFSCGLLTVLSYLRTLFPRPFSTVLRGVA